MVGGLDPISWTHSERRIRCPRWQTERRRFTEEFKQEAVRLCRQHDRSIWQIARELDLTESALRWVQQGEVDDYPENRQGRYPAIIDGNTAARRSSALKMSS